MTLRELAQEHLTNIDAQLVQLRQQSAQHAKESARLGDTAQDLQAHRDKWAVALESEKQTEET